MRVAVATPLLGSSSGLLRIETDSAALERGANDSDRFLAVGRRPVDPLEPRASAPIRHRFWRSADSNACVPGPPSHPRVAFTSADVAPQTVRTDIAVTATQLLLPMSESRSEIWMSDHADR
jgi:hypothetical protein